MRRRAEAKPARVSAPSKRSSDSTSGARSLAHAERFNVGGDAPRHSTHLRHHQLVHLREAAGEGRHVWNRRHAEHALEHGVVSVVVLTSDGSVLYRFKRSLRDGTTHVHLSPTEFIERLAALVPPPRRHMVTYHGVLAPAAGYRDAVVPEDPPYRDPVHRHRRKKPEGDEPTKPKRRPALWPELLRRTFGLDALHCPLCGGRRELIALITQPHTAQHILAAMGLPAEPGVLELARPPPQPRLPFVE